ncbi:hypothetical protein D3C81_2080360 [compost metagenome]
MKSSAYVLTKMTDRLIESCLRFPVAFRISQSFALVYLMATFLAIFFSMSSVHFGDRMP